MYFMTFSAFLLCFIAYIIIGAISAFVSYEYINEGFGKYREDIIFSEILFWPIVIPILIGLIIYNKYHNNDDNE